MPQTHPVFGLVAKKAILAMQASYTDDMIEHVILYAMSLTQLSLPNLPNMCNSPAPDDFAAALFPALPPPTTATTTASAVEIARMSDECQCIAMY
jgi:hypothetical protein